MILVFLYLFMMNKRCKNTLHKKYRRYRSDIWGKLAVTQKNNFITKLIYDFAQMTLRKAQFKVPRRRRIEKSPFKISRHIQIYGERFQKSFEKTLHKLSLSNFNPQYAFLGFLPDLDTILVTSAVIVPVIAFGWWCFTNPTPRFSNKKILEQFQNVVENDIQQRIDPIKDSVAPDKLTKVTQQVSIKKVSLVDSIESGKLPIKKVGDVLSSSSLETTWSEVHEVSHLGDPVWFFLNSVYVDIFMKHIPLTHSGYLYLVEWFSVLDPLEIHQHSRISWIILDFLIEFSKLYGLHA